MGEGQPNQERAGRCKILTCDEALSGAASHGRPLAGSPSGGKQYICIIFKIRRVLRPTEALLNRSAQVEENRWKPRKDIDGGGGRTVKHQPWQPAMASMEKTSSSLMYARVDLSSTSRAEWGSDDKKTG